MFYANPGIAALFQTDCGKKKWVALVGVLWRDALARRSALTEASLGLEGLWRGALADALAMCSAFKDALAGRSALCGDPMASIRTLFGSVFERAQKSSFQQSPKNGDFFL